MWPWKTAIKIYTPVLLLLSFSCSIKLWSVFLNRSCNSQLEEAKKRMGKKKKKKNFNNIIILLLNGVAPFGRPFRFVT